MYSNVYDGGIDFEVYGFSKSTKLFMSGERNIIYSLNKKINPWYGKGYKMGKT